MDLSERTTGLRRFDDLAGPYESWFESRIGSLVERRETALLARLVAPAPGQTILEVGSGTGHFARQFAGAGARCVGIEPSDEMLAVATSQAGAGVRYVRGCGESLPFMDGAFECVCYITTLEFVAGVAEAIREAARVCKDGGRLVFVVLNVRGPWYRQRQREGGLWHETRFYGAEELRGLVSPLGAVEVDFCVHAPPWLGWLPAGLLSMADSLCRQLFRKQGALIGVRVDLRRPS
jgi:SAM-dependent methyltransferase